MPGSAGGSVGFGRLSSADDWRQAPGETAEQYKQRLDWLTSHGDKSLPGWYPAGNAHVYASAFIGARAMAALHGGSSVSYRLRRSSRAAAHEPRR